MSLDKSIKHGKDHRKEYRGSKRFDHSCRNHGSCSYCESNRKHATDRQLAKTETQEDEWFGYWGYADGADVISDLDEEQHNKVGLSAYGKFEDQEDQYCEYILENLEQEY